MQKIRVNFVGFGSHLDPQDNPILSILKKRYSVEVCEDAEFIFVCSTYLNKWGYYLNGLINGYVKYPGVRILFEGENLTPDFNLVDYAITSYPISFYDRNYYLPCGIEAFYVNGFNTLTSLPVGDRKFDVEDLKSKDLFANLISRHDSENGFRSFFFKKLSEYKRVESLGQLCHNADVEVSWRKDSKISFQRRCKFTICFESTKSEGFITEKILDAFRSGSVPIYYGSSNITSIFNKNAFINISSADDVESAIQRIIQIDCNDDLYVEMMRQPIFVDSEYPEKLVRGLEDFLYNIFDQQPEKAYRRSRIYSPEYLENYYKVSEKYMIQYIKRKERRAKLKSVIYNVLKKLHIKK